MSPAASAAIAAEAVAPSARRTPSIGAASGPSMRRSQPAAPAKAAARSAATTAKEMLRSNPVTLQYATTKTSSGPTVAAPMYQAAVASGSVRPRAIRHRQAAAITAVSPVAKSR